MTERARLTDMLALATQPREREYAIHDIALQGCCASSRTVHAPERSASSATASRRGGSRWASPTQLKAEQARAAALGHLRVGSVARADVARFFHEYGRRRPGGANRCHEILRNLFDCAVGWGNRSEVAGNPCKGIVPYRRRPRARLLGADDLAKLGVVLRRLEGKWLLRVAAVRLILLTGCRPSEIRGLRWCEVRPDRLALIDAKTGPRYVLLGEAARKLLKGLADRASGERVFPGETGDGSLTKGSLYWFWIKARDMAGIVADVRLRDLRHAHASHAVMKGESLHVAGRLLGHRRASTTNRYLDDATLSQASERIATAIERKLRPSNGKVRRAVISSGVSGTAVR